MESLPDNAKGDCKSAVQKFLNLAMQSVTRQMHSKKLEDAFFNCWGFQFKYIQCRNFGEGQGDLACKS